MKSEIITKYHWKVEYQIFRFYLTKAVKKYILTHIQCIPLKLLIYFKYIFHVKTYLTGLLSEKCPQKALWSFWKKSEKLKRILEKRYDHIGT